LTHSIASSFEFTCQIQKPANSSLVSVKGPSITVRLLPENRTRAPLELGWSPSPASITPAFASSSLNFPISARSCWLGISPASESFVVLIRIMNRMAVFPFYLFVERDAVESTVSGNISYRNDRCLKTLLAP
jgi:hypothetical protein